MSLQRRTEGLTFRLVVEVQAVDHPGEIADEGQGAMLKDRRAAARLRAAEDLATCGHDLVRRRDLEASGRDVRAGTVRARRLFRVDAKAAQPATRPWLMRR